MIELSIRTPRKRALVDITDQVRRSAAEDGVWIVYVPHTTAGVTINEGADPSVGQDLLMALERAVPEDLPYKHAEGNSPAHVMTTLVGTSVLVAVEGGELQLGTWQSVFLCEFDGPRTRRVWLARVAG